jgi:two-component system LytT family sensor kinase
MGRTGTANLWMKNRAGRVLLAALAWTVLGFLFALPSLSSGHWQRALLGSLGQWWSWGLVTPLILWADKRLPFSSKQLPQRMLAHLLPSFIFTSLYIYIFAAVLAVLRLGQWNALANTKILAGALRGMFLWSWLVYWLILGASQVYHYYEHYLSSELRMERLERNFSEARLNALRMQLDPHFLFNALNTISSQVERDPRLARRMIEHLGDLLRLSLESKDRQEVPLAEEISFLDHYVAIQKIRFGDQLKIETQISPEVKYASVPCLFVQPLVENAIRHGISRRSTGGTVIISARRVDDRLEIRIMDDGIGLPAEWTLATSKGLGLSVTRERIAGLYPNGASHFSVNRRESGGTEVEISLPLRMEANGHAPA